MKLGLSAGYWAAGPPPGVVEQIAEAERLGFDSMWRGEHFVFPRNFEQFGQRSHHGYVVVRVSHIHRKQDGIDHDQFDVWMRNQHHLNGR